MSRPGHNMVLRGLCPRRAFESQVCSPAIGHGGGPRVHPGTVELNPRHSQRQSKSPDP